MDNDPNKDADSLENFEPETNSIDSSAPVGASSEDKSKKPSETDGSSNKDSDKSPKNDSPKAKKAKDPNQPSLIGRIIDFIKRLDVFILIFLILVVVAGTVTIYVLETNKSAGSPTKAPAQNLNNSVVNQLNSNDSQVGSNSTTLNVQSNTVFAGTVLIRSSLNVAGDLKLGGTLTLPGITVSGATTLDQTNASNLTISGAEVVKGTLTVDSSASFGGSVTVPQLNVSNLQLDGDISITHHITTSAGIPTARGGNLGSGGTISVSGTDTAGTVIINTGGGAGSGCLGNITYTSSYASIPHVVISPASPGAAGVTYYTNASKSGFSICFTTNPGDSRSMSYNYISID